MEHILCLKLPRVSIWRFTGKCKCFFSFRIEKVSEDLATFKEKIGKVMKLAKSGESQQAAVNRYIYPFVLNLSLYISKIVSPFSDNNLNNWEMLKYLTDMKWNVVVALTCKFIF